MENLQSLVHDLRALILEVSREEETQEREKPLQTEVRTRVKDQLARKDLRLNVALALSEILHEFDGFESAETEMKRMVLEDTTRLLGRIDSLLETDQAFNTERIVLTDPPGILADVVAREFRAQEKQLAEMERKQQQQEQARRASGERKSSSPTGAASGRRSASPGDAQEGRRRSRGRPEQKTASAPPAAPASADSAQGDRHDLKFQKNLPHAGEGGTRSRAPRRRRRPRRPKP